MNAVLIALLAAAIIGCLALATWASGILRAGKPSSLPRDSFERFTRYEREQTWRRTTDEPRDAVIDETEEAS